MFIVRAIRKDDLPAFIQLAFKAKIGLTSLPKNEARLAKILDNAVGSFSKEISTPGHDIYLFVLEETTSKTVCGVSGIYSHGEDEYSIHYFKILFLPIEKAFPETPESIEVLEPVSYPSEPTEIGSLFLDPNFRQEGLGKLLSFSRFLFIANFPERFTDTVFALMRSYLDEDDENPFWNNVGRKFLDISFKTLIKRKDEGHDVFPPLLARFSILVPFLSREARKAIGNVYQSTLPALHMLKEQGFEYHGEIDAIDGGPKVVAKRDNIKVIRGSQKIEVTDIEDFKETPTSLISNCSLDFRCCLGALKNKRTLSREAADLLQVKKGDFIRFVEM